MFLDMPKEVGVDQELFPKGRLDKAIQFWKVSSKV